uniref:Uncharacterized protein n=1 Tax=Opuntia streptacantha TaxID=393608 RepID=A0A7C9AIW5_OPUST
MKGCIQQRLNVETLGYAWMGYLQGRSMQSNLAENLLLYIPMGLVVVVALVLATRRKSYWRSGWLHVTLSSGMLELGAQTLISHRNKNVIKVVQSRCEHQIRLSQSHCHLVIMICLIKTLKFIQITKMCVLHILGRNSLYTKLHIAEWEIKAMT